MVGAALVTVRNDNWGCGRLVWDESRRRVFNSRKSVQSFALPQGTLALCSSYQAARRGGRGEGASVSSGSGVSRLRVLLAEGGSPR